MALHDDVCFLQLTGWPYGDPDASEEERSDDCRRVRMGSDSPVPYCAVHGSLAESSLTTGEAITDNPLVELD